MVAAVLAASCAEAPPEPAPNSLRPDVLTVPDVPANELRAETVERRLRHGTLRVRTRGCLGLGTGSAFAVSHNVIVTNRHVIEQQSGIQVTSWDGHTWDAEIVAAAMAGDLGLVLIDGTLPVALTFDPDYVPGQPVTAVGYPGGQRISFSDGTVVDDQPGEVFGESGRVVRVDAAIEPGNSGGPVVNEAGEVVAVVFAIETATGLGLAIPISTLLDLAEAEGFVRLDPSC